MYHIANILKVPIRQSLVNIDLGLVDNFYWVLEFPPPFAIGCSLFGLEWQKKTITIIALLYVPCLISWKNKCVKSSPLKLQLV